jgi:hypothetical protein
MSKDAGRLPEVLESNNQYRPQTSWRFTYGMPPLRLAVADVWIHGELVDDIGDTDDLLCGSLRSDAFL